MKNFRNPAYVIALLLLISINSRASNSSAWDALSNLNAAEAKRLFAEARIKDPKNFELMRGLYLAASFDLDHDTQAAMVDTILHYYPASNYLTPLFEHLTASLDGWTDQQRLSTKLAKSLVKNCKGPLAFTGEKILEGRYIYRLEAPPADWKKAVNKSPGFWVCGPFDNTSHIAVYRNLKVETAPLDTGATIEGKHGFAARWTWLETTATYHVVFGQTTDYSPGDALVLRTFFELPEDTELLILPGGTYSGRLRIDGKVVVESVRYRNASQREGCRLKLTAGTHQITAVLCDLDDPAAFSLSILGTDYRPIQGFRWLRYAAPSESASSTVSATPVHPIFDPWKEFSSHHTDSPDNYYWGMILMVYNGFDREAIKELEKRKKDNNLSPLETTVLVSALAHVGEVFRSNEVLSELHDQSPCANIDVMYYTANSSGLAESVRQFEELRAKYGSRLEIEMMAAFKPLLSSNVGGFIDNFDSLIARNPRAAVLDQILSRILGDNIGNYDRALECLRSFCDKTGNEVLLTNSLSRYLTKLGRLDEACKAARRTLGVAPVNVAVRQVYEAYWEAQKLEEILPLFDSLIARYPANINLRLYKYSSLYGDGKFAAADEVLKEIHELKPSAVSPYATLPELHHNISLDSLLGTVDVMPLWESMPDSADLTGDNVWSLFNKIQYLITDEGPILNDIHIVQVVLDESAVQNYQQIQLPVDLSSKFDNLLIARRLRQGSTPLAAQQSGDTVIFQDLRPGDAVELRYRFWSSEMGDLWRHWWVSSDWGEGYFQRYLEIVVLTDRDDLIFSSTPPCPDVARDEYCGYHRFDWRQENIPVVNSKLWYQPPDDEMYGKLYLTTIDSWDSIGSWYGAVTEALLRDNPRAEDLSDSLTMGLTNDRDKLEALYKYGLFEIPYQAIGFDYDASIPHDPDQVLLNGWGDCKDKSFLLISMLRRAGISAWPVLVKTRTMGTQLPVPQFSFNHLITACKINNDTLFLDPTGYPNSIGECMQVGIAGQPCLQVTAGSGMKLDHLRKMKAADYARIDTLTVDVAVGEPSNITYKRCYGNLAAGAHRDDLKQIPEADLAKSVENGISDVFNIVVKIDSINADTVISLAPWHREMIYGKMELTSQSVGKTTVLQPPIYIPISKQSLSNLYGPDGRGYPVDLHWTAGTFNKNLVLKIPDELGVPQIGDPVHVKDSLWELKFATQWNGDTRELTLDYNLRIEAGQSPPEPFENFMRRMIDVYSSPVIFVSD